MLFLVVLGGAAVLEVHRALQHNGGNEDLRALREKEAALRKQLQDVQRDLRAAQQQRQLTESEAAQLAAVNTRLAAENADLAASSTQLKAENEALAARADSLLERQAALEAAAESLKLENCTLLQQFDRLKIKYEQESAAFQEQVSELKAAVSGALQRFTAGEISADQLIAYLSAMGVELRGRKEALESLPEQLNSARSTEERLKLLDRVEVDVGEGWLQQMRLITAEPDRAARLLAGAAAARGNAAAVAAAAALTEGSEAAAGASSSGAVALTYAQPAKLPTPLKDRPTAQLPSVKVPPLKLAGMGGTSTSSASSAATAALPPAAADENAAANAAEVAAPAAGDKAAAGKAKKGGAMRFLPGKKVARKQAVPAPAPQLAVDLPLSQRGDSALPRLPFDAVNDDLDMPGSKSLMAL